LELLRADGLALSIVFTSPDGEGWMWCNAIISAPGFRGELDFQMLRSDLDWFRSQLLASIDVENWPCDVRLSSTDPGIDLSFRVERTGQVVGSYQLGGFGAHCPSLSGTFGMDQTYLVPMLAQLDGMLCELD
jgi:hypothetical protein